MKLRYLLLLCFVALLCSAVPMWAYTEVLYDFPLDSSPSWTMTGGWQYGAATGIACVTGAHTGTNFYGFSANGGTCPGDSYGATPLTTTALNCSSASNVTLSFWRNLGLAPYGDRAAVEVSNNGSTWTTVWQTTAFLEDSGWVYCQYDITSVASGQSNVYIRWVQGPSVNDGCYCYGWNVDDVQITTERPEAYYFPLDTDPGWSRGGDWAFGAPIGGGGDCGYADPTSGHTGSYVFGYNLSGDYPNYMAAYSLTTSALDCTAMTGGTLSFWRWLGVESSYYDHAYVQVSNDGSTWTTVWENGTGYMCGGAWEYCSYDISAVADGQPTVYVRWIMGTSDSSYALCGWNLDDISITSGGVTQILAWTPYSDWYQEYTNTISALTSVYPNVAITATGTEDASTLATQLVGKHVFLVPEPELACPGDLPADGAAFADVLRQFVEGGGTVIVCGESDWACGTSGFLNATGLMEIHPVTYYYSGEALPVTLAWHPLALGLGGSVAAMDATTVYDIGPEAYAVIEDSAGNAVVAARQIGAGAVVAIGYDYYSYDASAAQVIANAVQYPRGSKQILVYDDYVIHPVQEALGRLAYPYQTCDNTTYSTAIPSQYWDLVLMDNPAYALDDSYLASYVAGGGHSAVSSWGLQAYPRTTLATAFGVTPVQSLTTPAPVYRWDTAGLLFNLPQSVPDLLTWNEIAGYDADRLTASAPDACAVAGFTASPASDQAALVVGNGERTVMNGFLWDEGSQDTNANGIQDMVELIMNETQFLLRVPHVNFSADVTECVVGDAVTFTSTTTGPLTEMIWELDPADCWDCTWDGDPVWTGDSHVYDEVGFYSPVLWAYNNNGLGAKAKPGYLAVGFTDAGPSHWAFRYIIACQDAGVVGGYWDGYHPEETVNRAQMAVYMARALADGDANVPPGPGTATFTDVPTDYWAFKYVEYCYANGVVGGYWDGYHPDETVNRGQMAVYVARAMAGGDGGVPPGPGTATFTDVPTDFWAFKYVEYCYTNGVVSGYWDGYRPVENVNRGQMAVYVQRAFDYETYAP